MDHNQLLDRIKERDMAAYHHLTQDYGWKLYSYLKTRFQDKETLDAVFNETLNKFYNTIAGSDDVIEALLYSFADQTCQTMMPGKTIAVAKGNTKKASGKVGTILFYVSFGFLLFGIFAALWVIVGLLMGLGIMPELDLGYSWFNANVFPWF